MITAINDTLCPNTTLGELTGNTASLTGTDENGNTVTITSGMKVLDTKNCSTGSDKQIPPQELFTRLGTERYTKFLCRRQMPMAIPLPTIIMYTMKRVRQILPNSIH